MTHWSATREHDGCIGLLSHMAEFINIAAYKFASLDGLEVRRTALLELCHRLDLKGTIILSPEGINMFVAGVRANIDALMADVRSDPELADLEVKESVSDHQPFTRMLVKVKREIIAFGVEGIDPRRETSPRVTAAELKQWLDEGRDVALLDVRNNFEYEVGTFDNAIPIDIDDFRRFPDALPSLSDELKRKPVVTFCTGGIRCEKAAPLLEQHGFQNVFQLDGGILKYFEDVGGEHYHGECFVFDKRVALDEHLQETDTAQCYLCQAILDVEDRKSPLYTPGVACPHCYVSTEEQLRQLKADHESAIDRMANPLPGSMPYENIRTLHVPGRYDGSPVIEFLTSLTPRITKEDWQQVMADGQLSCDGVTLRDTSVVRAGQSVVQCMPDFVEPDVNADILILHEDDAIIVIDKPAPLPMHPSGRFNRNTLSWILNQVLKPTYPRSAHRLDANTSGVVVFAKTRRIASRVQPQFERGEVEKRYVARVAGRPASETFESTAPISREPASSGGRAVTDDGLEARTIFTLLHSFSDGTCLVEAKPLTGRTNQIRIHLWDIGLPIVGDPLYLPNGQRGQAQTLRPDDPPMCLHAQRISFQHPRANEVVTYESPLPPWAMV